MSRDILFTFQSGADLNDLWESIAMPRDIYGSAGSDNLSAAERFGLPLDFRTLSMGAIMSSEVVRGHSIRDYPARNQTLTDTVRSD